MSLAFRVENMEVEGKTLRCGVLELENAVVALFWEGEEPKLGSTTVTLPGMASTQLLCDRDQLTSRDLISIGPALSTKNAESWSTRD